MCNSWPFIVKGFPPDEKHLHGVGLEIKNFAPNVDWDAESYCRLAEKLREIEPRLSEEDSVDKKWASISSSL